MTPLEIHLILNLYHDYQPYNSYPAQQRHAPAMVLAFAKFERLGFLADGVTYKSVMVEQDDAENYLSSEGLELVQRLMEVEP